MIDEYLLYHPTEDKKINKYFYKTGIDGLFYFEAIKHNDQRGFFSELMHIEDLNDAIGFKFDIKQINLARNNNNTAKGMHAEGWNKLVTVVNGSVFSALVDIRPNSKTFKKVEYFILSFNKNTNTGNGLFITKGIANSLVVLDGPADYLYLVDKLYKDRDPEDNLSINMFDKELNIKWPIPKEQMILSERDKNAISLKEMLSLR